MHHLEARDKRLIAHRMQTIRLELYGENGGPMLAGQLGLPFRTWANYESGVTIPGEILLSFLQATAAHPLWLLHGIEPKYMAKRIGASTATRLEFDGDDMPRSASY